MGSGLEGSGLSGIGLSGIGRSGIGLSGIGLSGAVRQLRSAGFMPDVIICRSDKDLDKVG